MNQSYLLPINMKYNITPQLQISASFGSYGSFFKISGLIYERVPQVVLLRFGMLALGFKHESPKSIMLINFI